VRPTEVPVRLDVGAGEEHPVAPARSGSSDHELVGEVGEVRGHDGDLHRPTAGGARRGGQVPQAMPLTIRIGGDDRIDDRREPVELLHGQLGLIARGTGTARRATR